MAYLAPAIWGTSIPSFGRVNAIRITFTAMAAAAFVCMLVPVFCIREKDYVDTVPSKDSAFRSLTATFRNGEFRKFVGSDIFYWIALTMFQTGLPFFVTSLLKLPETMTTLYFVGMTALSLVFYVPVNKLTPKLGKKKMILFAFAVFSLAYFYTGFMGNIPFIPETVQGLILTVVQHFPCRFSVFCRRQLSRISHRAMQLPQEAAERECSTQPGPSLSSWARAFPC